jgi:superfamily II DNA or RNA helicase
MLEPHEYQDTAAKQALAELDRRQAALVVMPTGTGKSMVGALVMAEVVRRGGRGGILVHRREFIPQWGRALDNFDISWGVEQAEQKCHRDTLHGRIDCVIMSKDTMRGKRLERWSPNTFSMIISDESHHGTARSFTNVFGHFHSARRLGLTATPERSDDESIQTVFGNVAYELPFWQAVDHEYIAAPYFRRPPVGMDLSALATSGDDLNQGDLEDTIRAHIEELVNLALPEVSDGRPVLTFTPRVHSATAMAAGFRTHPLGFASCSVSGKSEDRDLVIQQYRDGDFRNCCSCDLLREGTDFPDAANLVMARPTKSGLVYRQMLGRVLRKKPDNYAVVVDYAVNSGRHDLFQPINLFDASGMDLDVLARAGRLIDEGKHQDAREAIQEAERVHAQEVALRVQVRERTPSYRMLAYDPFQIGTLLGIPNRQRAGQRACSARNRALLERFKLNPGSISDRQAKALIAELESRREQHLGTHRQVACLVANGVPQEIARALPFDAASEDMRIIIGDRKRA